LAVVVVHDTETFVTLLAPVVPLPSVTKQIWLGLVGWLKILTL
jgi:hypothetical protein